MGLASWTCVLASQHRDLRAGESSFARILLLLDPVPWLCLWKPGCLARNVSLPRGPRQQLQLGAEDAPRCGVNLGVLYFRPVGGRQLKWCAAWLQRAAWRHVQQRRFGRKRVRKTRDGQGRRPARRKRASCLHARARYTPATCTTLIHHIIGCRVCSVAHLSNELNFKVSNSKDYSCTANCLYSLTNY